MPINPQIFREYDIRGIVDRDLSGDVAENIGRAFGSELRQRLGEGDFTISVGHDNRPSSPGLADGIIRGITSTGVNVIDCGTVPTPLLYYAAAVFETEGGLQITGSHNPPEYNGFKMVLRGRAIYGEAIQGLRRRIDEKKFASGKGKVEKRAVIPRYIEDLGQRFTLQRPVKVVADCG